jgi:uncharacterized protein YndB with AHSA1/START domain
MSTAMASRHVTSVTIQASQETVWSVLSDVAAWPSWLPTVTSVEPQDGRELKLGARYRVVQPKLRPGIWSVTALEPPRRFTWEARWPGLRAVGDHVVERAGGGCEVRLGMAFSGLLGGLVGLLARSITESYLAQEAASLQARVEGRS